MEKAKVFLIEDDEVCRDITRRSLEQAGHRVVLEAMDLKQALETICSGKMKESGVTVAVVDNRLPANRLAKKDMVCGNIIAKDIRDADPSIKIVSHSSSSAAHVTYGDEYVWKFAGLRALPDAIEKL